MAATKFCRECGLEAPLPESVWNQKRPPCSSCGNTAFVDEADMTWRAKVNNEHDQQFLKVNRIGAE